MSPGLKPRIIPKNTQNILKNLNSSAQKKRSQVNKDSKPEVVPQTTPKPSVVRKVGIDRPSASASTAASFEENKKKRLAEKQKAQYAHFTI